MNDNSFLRNKVREFLKREEVLEYLKSNSTKPSNLTVSTDLSLQLFSVVRILTERADELDHTYAILSNTLFEHNEHQREWYFDPVLISRGKSKEIELEGKLRTIFDDLVEIRRWQALAHSFLYELLQQQGTAERKTTPREHLLKLTEEGIQEAYLKMYTMEIEDDLLSSTPPEIKTRPLRLTKAEEIKLNRAIVNAHDRMFDDGKPNDEIWKILSEQSDSELGFHLTPDAIRGRYDRNWKKYLAEKKHK
jgi:hypothetical protein